MPSASVEPTASSTADPTVSQQPVPTPASQVAATLLFRFGRVTSVGESQPLLSVYEDGQLLTQDSRGRLMRRLLTNRGMTLLRNAALDTGLFTQSATFLIEVKKGAVAPGIDTYVDMFRVGPIVVRSVPFDDPTWVVPSVERARLRELATHLSDLSWLPADAWRDGRATPYEADAYVIFAGTLPISRGEGSGADVSDVAWPFVGWPEHIGEPLDSGNRESYLDHCLVVDSTATVKLNAALRDFALEEIGQPADLYWSLDIPWRERDLQLRLVARALLPDETATCAGKKLPPEIDL
jgi:hypothetical protein